MHDQKIFFLFFDANQKKIAQMDILSLLQSIDSFSELRFNVLDHINLTKLLNCQNTPLQKISAPSNDTGEHSMMISRLDGT